MVKTDLIKKALLGDCDEKELEQVKEFLNSHEGTQFISEHFEKYNISKEDILSQTEEERLLDNIHTKINIEELIHEIGKEHKRQDEHIDRSRQPIPYYKTFKHKRKLSSIASYAAVIVFVALIAVGYNFLSGDWNDTNTDKDEMAWIEKSTDRGQQLTIRLVDGTQVILNANSSIRYPETFSDSVRMVAIQGEAYFEVTHNASRPFIVDAGRLTSKVLGTSFNIINDPTKKTSTVSLVTGKVEVTQKDNNKKLVLAPGEEASVNEEEGIKKNEFEVERTIAWKDKIIYFTGDNYPEVFEVLENWYGVNINYSNPSGKQISWKLTAKFENESLENVLNALSESHGIRYSIDGKNVIIKF